MQQLIILIVALALAGGVYLFLTISKKKSKEQTEENAVEMMTANEKYCQSIKSTILRFGDDFDTFNTDIDYRNSVCMSILQIGELSRRLSEDYKNEKSEIPWKQIIGLRNICAHAYNTVDYEGIFEIAHSDIDELKKFCECELQFIELINQPENQNSYDDEEFEL